MIATINVIIRKGDEWHREVIEMPEVSMDDVASRMSDLDVLFSWKALDGQAEIKIWTVHRLSDAEREQAIAEGKIGTLPK